MSDLNYLNPLVQNIPALQALNKYLTDRIETLTKEFRQVKTLEELRALQRTIDELEKLKGLREKVIAHGN